MSFMEKMSTLSQNVSNKAKDTAGVVRINSQISESEKALNSLYHEIGRKYCEIHDQHNIPVLADSVEQVKLIVSQIDQMRKQVNVLKGVMSCPKCNAQVKSGTMFCSTCGYQFPVVMKKRCKTCGCELNDDQAFCINCGTPAANEAPAPAPAPGPGPGVVTSVACPTCGQMVPGEMNFCKFCGTKVK